MRRASRTRLGPPTSTTRSPHSEPHGTLLCAAPMIPPPLRRSRLFFTGRSASTSPSTAGTLPWPLGRTKRWMPTSPRTALGLAQRGSGELGVAASERLVRGTRGRSQRTSRHYRTASSDSSAAIPTGHRPRWDERSASTRGTVSERLSNKGPWARRSPLSTQSKAGRRRLHGAFLRGVPYDRRLAGERTIRHRRHEERLALLAIDSRLPTTAGPRDPASPIVV